MNGPDFIGIGVQRGGTSWLYQCFKEHPDILMPGKEIHFFDQQYHKGIEHYLALFATSNQNLVKGEMTPDYIFNKEAMTRLKAHCPDAKLILILRDPFERAYSAVGLLKATGRLNKASFEEVVDKQRWVIDQSLYYDQLNHLFSLFPKEQVQIFLFEDIESRPLWLLKTVFNFIGVNENFKPKSFQEKFNISGTSKFANVVNFEKIQTTLRHYALGRTLLKLKKLKLVKKLKHKLSSSPSNKKDNKLECPESIMDEFKADIVKTEKLLGMDLKRWYQS